MSSLAFDKQGKPFAWHKRTAKLRVRLFRTPSARGTCCQVLDGTGAPLFVDADIDYAEFRRAVNGVPGLYRLDQCDEDGVGLEDEPPAYVSIEQLRNAGGVAENAQPAEVSPLLIIERLVALQSDVMKTMAAQHAAILASSAEIMRAPYRPVPLLPATELRNADTGDEETEDEDNEEELADTSPFAPMLNMVEPHLPQLGAFLYTKFVEFFRKVPTAPATTPPAATSAPTATTPTSTSSTPRVVAQPVDVAAGFEPAGFQTEIFEAAIVDDVSDPAEGAQAPVAGATAVAPTPEQFAHLFAVRERLSPSEQALVEHVIKRMPPEALMKYLGTLSSLSIDEATTFIRSLIAQARPATAQ
ncbi:MAG TPA: hypothetical protein VG963_02435 [Polyangiaceae bacterium]|nr:hypothetical protein [Polyangiaceae bacterium]